MQAILNLYDRPPSEDRVVRVDEFGPLNLQPRKASPGGRSPIRTGSGPRTTATTV